MLGSEQIIGESGYCLKVAKLLASVVRLGGVGQHFDNQKWVEQEVGPALIEREWTTDTSGKVLMPSAV